MKYFLTYKVFLYVHLYQIINCCALEFMCIIIFICLFGFFILSTLLRHVHDIFLITLLTKCLTFFLLRLIIEMIEKRFLVEHRKLDLNCMVFPPSFFGLTLPVLPPFHLSLTFFTDYPKNTTPINPFTNAFAEKKKVLFFFYCSAFNIRH